MAFTFLLPTLARPSHGTCGDKIFVSNASATAVGKAPQQAIHVIETSHIDYRPPDAPRGDKVRVPQAIEVECQVVGRDVESRRDAPSRNAVRSGAREQPENVKTVVLGKGGQSRDGFSSFHISRIIEIWRNCQGPYQPSAKRGSCAASRS
jgi:hypothetical protein